MTLIPGSRLGAYEILSALASATQVNLGLNWFVELKRLLPASR